MIKNEALSVQSKVTAVTVFSDRAMVTRNAAADVKAGTTVVVFPNLPEGILERSVQAKGRGNAILRDVVFRQEHYAVDFSQAVRDLTDRRTSLADERKVLEDAIARAETQKSVIDGIATFLVSAGESLKKRDVEMEKWSAFADFHSLRHAALDAELQKNLIALRTLTSEQEQVERQLRVAGQRTDRVRNNICITVEAADAVSLSIELAYLITGPSWHPVYDLRAAADAESATIEYFGIISQHTGENWTDCALHLSTAAVQENATVPELDPWWINVFIPPPPPVRFAAPVAASMKEMAKSESFASGDMAEEEALEAEPSMDAPVATVQTGATSVVFKIDGSATVNGDGGDSKVLILRKEFPIELRYSSVPKKSERAFLEGRITNDSDFPFIQGQSNIYADSAFVGSAEIKTVMPAESFWVSLGIDEGMKIKYQQLKRYRKNEGVISKREIWQYEFLISATNMKKKKHSIRIQDQIPVSQNQEIAVKLISPAIKKDGECTLDEKSVLTWEFELVPGAKKELPFAFSVEYPKGSIIQNL